MRFGGHETFPIREGWLYKGLHLLKTEPSKISGDEAADWLGVGRNMAKSIRHWLVVTKLARPSGRIGKTLRHPLELTDLGELVWSRDPYFESIGTWWALHINLASDRDHAVVWRWFFNVFSGARFERSVCLEAAERYLDRTGVRMPSRLTLERDVACLLASYARTIPEERGDPEDNLVCPFTELGLMTYFKGTGAYEVHRGMRPLPPELLGYSLARALGSHDEGRHSDLPLNELWGLENGPARVFSLSNEAFFEAVLDAVALGELDDLKVVGLAGERVLRVTHRPALNWLRAYYESANQTPTEVAV